MQIHRIRGRSLQEALARAAELHGRQAVVLSQESDPDGGVTIAVSAPTNDALARFGFAPRAARGGAEQDTFGPGLADLRRRLVEKGCSGPFADEILAAVAERGTDEHPIDLGARVIGELLSVAPAPRATGRTRLMALVGPTGVGKTTTIAKLAHRLTAAGRRIALATLDGYRAGAADQLRAFTERLELPLWLGGPEGELGDELARAGDLDAVLVDTTGRSPADRAGLELLERQLASAGRGADTTTYLVLGANASRPALLAAQRAFAGLRPKGVILTKLDETPEPATALELALRSRWPLAFLCDGQDVDKHLLRPTPDRVADLVLLGRMA